ncbi:hypothetical protein [Candidatus Foliamicus sp.]
MRRLLLVGLTFALAGCAAQQTAVEAPAAEIGAVADGGQSAERRAERRRNDQNYVTSLERREVTGSRINRVRRRGEAREDKTAGKRVETISGEQIDELEERGYDGLSDVLPASE